MRLLALLSLLLLAGCLGSVRHEGFDATGPTAFLYSAHTNTVMTENDDGEAERLRRDWIADALRLHDMCPVGYVIDSRRFVPDVPGPLGSGGDVLYKGRCLGEPAPPPPPSRVIEEKREEKIFINDKIRGERG
jgi:hypothetical protein